MRLIWQNLFISCFFWWSVAASYGKSVKVIQQAFLIFRCSACFRLTCAFHVFRSSLSLAVVTRFSSGLKYFNSVLRNCCMTSSCSKNGNFALILWWFDLVRALKETLASNKRSLLSICVTACCLCSEIYMSGHSMYVSRLCLHRVNNCAKSEAVKHCQCRHFQFAPAVIYIKRACGGCTMLVSKR